MSRAKSEYRYEKLTWPEINDAVDLGKVCIVPCGAVEQHDRKAALVERSQFARVKQIGEDEQAVGVVFAQRLAPFAPALSTWRARENKQIEAGFAHRGLDAAQCGNEER